VYEEAPGFRLGPRAIDDVYDGMCWVPGSPPRAAVQEGLEAAPVIGGHRRHVRVIRAVAAYTLVHFLA